MSSGKSILSMKVKVLGLSLGAMAIASAIGAVAMNEGAHLQEAQALDGFAARAGNLSEQIAAQFFERYGDVQAFALNTTLKRGTDIERAALLDDLVRLYGIYDVVLLVDAKGQFVASNRVAPGGKTVNVDALRATNYAGTPWFQAAINGQFTEDAKRGFTGTHFEDVHLDPIIKSALGNDELSTGFSTTLKDDKGKVVGVITNRANLRWMEGELSVSFSALVSEKVPDAWITVVNKDGVLVGDFDPKEIKDGIFKRDLEHLLKRNLADESAAARRAVAGGVGHAIERDREGIDQAVGFRHIDSAKWIPSIGWSVVVYAPAKTVMASIETMEKIYGISIFASFLVIGLAVWILARRIAGRFVAVSDKLKEAAELTQSTASKLTEAAHVVAEASTEQSAATQETVSSMSEISSMIAQTNQNIRECTEIADGVTSKSEQGNQVMRRLAAAMDALSQANGQLKGMADIINEVSAKTMVINDIVFKTQLLSINASIEAARAGQHGKGFSVVAEEVGNLAQMSGNAAKEIQVLISDSQKQVGQIIEVTQARAREGQNVSTDALSAFSDIASGVQAMNSRLQGVAQATREQELGIQQINVAMGQMDVTTQRNSAASTRANELASELGSQSQRTYRVMRALRTLVLGSGERQAAAKRDVIDEIVGDAADLRSVGSSASATAQHVQAPSGLEEAQLASLSGRLAKRLGDVPAGAADESEGLDADSPEFKKTA